MVSSERRDLGAVAEAAVLLAMMRLAVGRLKFQRLCALVGLEPGESGTSADPIVAERVGAAMRRAAHRLPWESTCLMQALAGATMLRRRRAHATLQLGVAKDAFEPDGMSAHAWLRAGDLVLTGGGSSDWYRPVAVYHV